MSGRSTGLQIATFTGARVAGQLTYIPAHTKNGKPIQAQCIIPIFINSHHGTNAKTGEPGRVDSYKITAWGKLADTCCRSCSSGKALDLIVRPQSYTGRLFNQDGSLRLDNMGQPIEVPKVGFTIMSGGIAFGEDSAKTIQNEIQQGIRPMNWNVPGHPDWNLWIQKLQNRHQVQFVPGQSVFGYARVVTPQGPGISLNYTQPNQAVYGQQQMQAQYPTGNTEQMVHQVFNQQQQTSVPPVQNQFVTGAVNNQAQPVQNIQATGQGLF